MMLKRLKVLFFIPILLGVCACNQKHVKQIPISDFFKNPEKSFFRLSPDGKYISYLKPYKDKQNLFIQSLADGKEQMATSFTDYSVRGDYFWTYNNEIAFFKDNIGLDEIQMFALDVSTLEVHPVISQKKVRIAILSRDKMSPDIITVRMNKRD